MKNYYLCVGYSKKDSENMTIKLTQITARLIPFYLLVSFCVLLLSACNYVYDKTIDIPVTTLNKLVL